MSNLSASGVTLTGSRLEKTKRFLSESGLRFEGGADYTAQITSETGDIIGSGSLCNNVLKYIAVSPALQGEGGATIIVSELVSEAYRRGISKLFLFTKPQNEALFHGVGFYTIVATSDVCLMENSRSGLDRWLASLKHGTGVQGAAVVNCNPFTLGHRYLIETAAKQTDTLHVFVVSEDRSMFSFKDRLEMVRRGTADIPNLLIHPSGDYMISYATFPTYFLKENAYASSVNATLDATLFGKRIAKPLGITKRFVGTEPYCAVTRSYNECLKSTLPPLGVEVTELPRIGGISASRVRAAIESDDKATLCEILPESTLNYIKEEIKCVKL